MAGRACPAAADGVKTMHRATTTGIGRRFGSVAAAAMLAAAAAATALPATAGAVGGAEPVQRDREVREEREVRRLDIAAGGSYIGVTVREVAQDDGAAAGEGAVVEDVRDGGPAAEGGVEAGDVVVEFDGERVRGTRQLTRLVRETPAGRSVPVAVLRDGARVTLNVTPEERGGAWMARRPTIDVERFRGFLSNPRDGWVWEGNFDELEDIPAVVATAVASLTRRARLGIQADAVNGQLAEYFGVTSGVLVRHVEDDTVAAAAGLRAGDVITAMDGEAVDDVATLRRQLADLEPGAPFTLAVTRDGAGMSLTGELAGEEEQRPRPSRGSRI